MTVNWNDDAILAQRRTGGTSDPFQSIEENLTVIQGKTILTEIPNKANKVLVNASDLYSSGTTYQIGDLVYTETSGVKSSFECIVSCLNKPVTNATYWEAIYFIEVLSNSVVLDNYDYYVDYTNGIIFHNNCFTNSGLIYKYLGEGIHFFPASRIYAENSGNDVTQTLQDIIDSSVKTITFNTVVPTSEDGENGDVWFVYQE